MRSLCSGFGNRSYRDPDEVILLEVLFLLNYYSYGGYFGKIIFTVGKINCLIMQDVPSSIRLYPFQENNEIADSGKFPDLIKIYESPVEYKVIY